MHHCFVEVLQYLRIASDAKIQGGHWKLLPYFGSSLSTSIEGGFPNPTVLQT